MIYIEIYRMLSQSQKEKLYKDYGIDCAYDLMKAINYESEEYTKGE